MGSIIRKLFGKRVSDNYDDVIGRDMVPAPSVLSTLNDTPMEDALTLPASSGSGSPFTTIVQAPIRDS